MTKPLTENQILVAICYSTMRAWNFSYARRLEWIIWAAKHQECSSCHSAPYKPCINLADVRLNKTQPRINRTPHDDRVDWARLLNGLKNRGYYKPAIETQVRKQVRLQNG